MKKRSVLIFALALSLLSGCGGNRASAEAEWPQGTTEAESVQEQAAEAAEETQEAQDVQEEQAPENEAEPATVRIAALKGPTAMGMVQFMSEAEAGSLTDNDYQFSIAGSADEITPLIVKGELDIAALPANLASVLYNNMEGGLQTLAVNTLGVLYIVENGETIASVEDIRGKTIYASGKGSTPEYALNYVLAENGIDPERDVSIEWKSEHAECLSALLAQENAIAMLPQPFVTTAQTKSGSIRVALDMTEEWDKLQEGKDNPSALITGVVVARKSFVEEQPQAVLAFLAHYRDSVEYVNGNVEEAAVLVGNYEIVTAEVAQKAIPFCGITFIEGEEMEEKLSGYLAVLFEQNAKSVGGALPEEDFYFSE